LLRSHTHTNALLAHPSPRPPPTPCAGSGKGGKSGKAAAAPGGGTRKSSSAKAGLTFPAARLKRFMKKLNVAPRISTTGSIYAAAVLEYLTAEILELAGNAARDMKRKRILPRAINLAIVADEELAKLLAKVTIAGGGVQPHM